MQQLHRLVTDFIGLLFPACCNACGTHLYHGEKEICTKCLYQLPYTDYHDYPENRVAKQLWGRLPCQDAMAMLYFKKGTSVQHLLHNLKYNGKTELGIKLGQLLGERLKASKRFKGMDLIIPIPLHRKREKARGYNQSKLIADGLANVLQVPVSTQHVLRKQPTASQTRKSRYDRFENLQHAFAVQQKEELQQKHILLVDDVITTGATLEACGLALLNCGVKKISVAAVAFAE